MTGSGDLPGGGRRQVGRRGVHACGCDRSHRRVAIGHAVDAPTDGSVDCVCYRRRKGRLTAKHQRRGRRFYGPFDQWRRRSASCATTERPYPFDKERHSHDRPGLESFFVARREGPHANTKAGQWPEKLRRNRRLVHLGSKLEPWGNSAVSYREHACMQIPALTSLAGPPIIRAMPRPDAVRRVKSYSAADGYVYQYYFFEGNRAKWQGKPGGEFTYVVSIDRRSAFPFKIFVTQSALDSWAKLNGRA